MIVSVVGLIDVRMTGIFWYSGLMPTISASQIPEPGTSTSAMITSGGLSPILSSAVAPAKATSVGSSLNIVAIAIYDQDLWVSCRHRYPSNRVNGWIY